MTCICRSPKRSKTSCCTSRSLSMKLDVRFLIQSCHESTSLARCRYVHCPFAPFLELVSNPWIVINHEPISLGSHYREPCSSYHFGSLARIIGKDPSPNRCYTFRVKHQAHRCRRRRLCSHSRPRWYVSVFYFISPFRCNRFNIDDSAM